VQKRSQKIAVKIPSRSKPLFEDDEFETWQISTRWTLVQLLLQDQWRISTLNSREANEIRK